MKEISCLLLTKQHMGFVSYPVSCIQQYSVGLPLNNVLLGNCKDWCCLSPIIFLKFAMNLNSWTVTLFLFRLSKTKT